MHGEVSRPSSSGLNLADEPPLPPSRIGTSVLRSPTVETTTSSTSHSSCDATWRVCHNANASPRGCSQLHPHERRLSESNRSRSESASDRPERDRRRP